MGVRRKILLLVFVSFFLPYLAKASDNFLIYVHFFQATLEDQPQLKQVEVLSLSSRSELSSLMDKVTGSEYELTAAVIDVLLEIYEIDEIEDLFLHEKAWNGLGHPLLDDIMFGDPASYQIKLSPKKMPSQQIALQAVILETKNRDAVAGWEEIIDQGLVLDIDEPVIVAVPCQERMYFMLVTITTGIPSEKWKEQRISKKKEPIEIVGIPKVIHHVEPSYPKELWRRRIGGKIGLRITIDDEGIVQRVDVLNSIHPYLNYTTVQALRQWTFKPVLFKEKPVPVVFRCTYTFDPFSYWRERTWNETGAAPGSSSQEELLRRVLDGGGDYCRKLAGAVFDFICEEKIKETYYNLLKNINWATIAVGPKRSRSQDSTLASIHAKKPSDYIEYAADASKSRSILKEDGDQVIVEELNPMPKPKVVRRFQIIDPKKTQRNKFQCDYLIVKKDGEKDERRIILKENGRRTTDRNEFLEEERFAGLSPLFAPLRILAPGRQGRFNYKIIDTKNIHGKKAHVIEALPRYGNEEGIWSARLWIDTQSFRVLKCEIEGIPIDGYEEVLNDCVILNIKPIFLTTHEYRNEKNSILFPSRSSVRVAYPGIDYRGAIDKIRINLSYDNYKFFTVETDQEVIKKISADLLIKSSRERLKFKKALPLVPCTLRNL